eukprot:5076710-Amphidinium_carterae.3
MEGCSSHARVTARHTMHHSPSTCKLFCNSCNGCRETHDGSTLHTLESSSRQHNKCTKHAVNGTVNTLTFKH